MKYDIVALGELLIDFAMRGSNEEGYPLMQANPGGAPANFLAAAARAGLSTALLGKVGADQFGSLLTGTLEKAGISTEGIVRDASCFTTLAFVTFDSQGDRTFSFARKPGADMLLRREELRLDMIDQSRAFHFGTLSLTDEPARSATECAVAYAKERGKLITFDPNLRLPLWTSADEARERILWGLSQADIIKISDEEIRFLYDLEPEEGIVHILESTDAKLVFGTCGPDGAAFASVNGCRGRASSPEVTPVDTTGAGDIFGGTAVSCILRSGRNPGELTAAQLQKMTAIACEAASRSTEKPGGISSIPDIAHICTTNTDNL